MLYREEPGDCLLGERSRGEDRHNRGEDSANGSWRRSRDSLELRWSRESARSRRSFKSVAAASSVESRGKDLHD